MMQTMKFLIVKSSPLPIPIPLGPKYSPQDPVFKYPTSSTGRLLLKKHQSCGRLSIEVKGFRRMINVHFDYKDLFLT